MEKIELFILSVILVSGVLALMVIHQMNAGMAISTTYHTTPEGQGIVSPYPGPSANVQVPFSEIQLLGTRIPGFIILGDTNMAYLSQCRNDLIWDAHITSPKSRFSCFVIPVRDGKHDYSIRSPTDPWTGTGPGGDVFCYAGTTGSESQGIDSEERVREKINTVLVGQNENWEQISVVNSNGKRAKVPVCGVKDRYGHDL